MEACAGSFGVRRAAAAATVAAVDTVQLPYGVAVPGVGAAEEGGVRRVDEDDRMWLKEVLMISLLAVSLEEYGVPHTVVIPLEEVVSLLLPVYSGHQVRIMLIIRTATKIRSAIRDINMGFIIYISRNKQYKRADL